MADTTKIEWTDATWNIITGCTLVDEGCRHCYAAHLITSWPAVGNHPSRKGLARKNAAGESKFTGEVRFNEQWLDQPLRWRKPRRIFVCAHGDLFHEAVPDEWLDRVFAVMALAPQHTFQVLTKRPERARAYMQVLGYVGTRQFIVGDKIDDARSNGEDWLQRTSRLEVVNDGYNGCEVWPLPNVHLGTSISDQASADRRIPHLLATPAAVHFLSVEPMLGPVDVTAICTDDLGIYPLSGVRADGSGPSGFSQGHRIDWVICGGESGPHARPMHPDWARDLRDQCVAEGTRFFFKQWGEWAPLDTTAECAGLVTGKTPRAQWHDACGLIIDTPDTEDGLTFFSEGTVYRIGKARAGRLLDGREWNELPGVKP